MKLDNKKISETIRSRKKMAAGGEVLINEMINKQE